MGPAPILSNQGFRFYVIFIDDYLRFPWMYSLQNKSNFLDCFLRFQNPAENQFDRRIKVFQSDNQHI